MEGLEIFDPKGMAESMRHNEYNDICSALAEIVDNSLEANAHNIVIYCKEGVSKTGEKIIQDIAIIDDGKGMDQEQLHRCLVYGKTTSNRKGIGKFGVGLGQASLFAAPRVEVYSWRDSNKYMVYLDCAKLKSGQQEKIDFPVEACLPEDINEILNQTYPENNNAKGSGTVVLWKDVDKISYRRLGVLYKNIGNEIGRKFRYFIQNGCNIYFRKSLYDELVKIKAIDPLFIMDDTKFGVMPAKPYEYTENGSDTLFEKFITDETPEGELVLPIKHNKHESNLKIKFTIVKKQYYYDSISNLSVTAPGFTKVGDMLKKYEGISIVRAGREIDFGRFDIYDSINDPVNRWWGIEISFQPDLDDFFTVSNNKQHVEIKSKVDDEDEYNEWFKIKQLLKKFIRQMKEKNKIYRDEFLYAKRNCNTVDRPKNDLEEGYKIDSTEDITAKSKLLCENIDGQNDCSVKTSTNIEFFYLEKEIVDSIEVIFERNKTKIEIDINSKFYKQLLQSGNLRFFEKYTDCLINTKDKLLNISEQIGAMNLIKKFFEHITEIDWRNS